MDRGACQTTVHGVTKSWTRLSDEHITSISNVVINFHFHVYTHTHTHTHTFGLSVSGTELLKPLEFPK